MSESYEQWLARSLSFTQWEFLADHFSGPRLVLPNESRTRLSLANRKLIRCEPTGAAYPTQTILTEKGHGAMCAAMGMMADMLIAMGHDGVSNPPQTKSQPPKYGYGPRKETKHAARPALEN